MTYLPTPFKKFVQAQPQVAATYEQLALACHAGGPLDEKTRRLVKLGIAIGAESEGAVKSHARRALEGGCSPDEVRHAVLLALTTAGFPAMIAANEWIDEVLGANEKTVKTRKPSAVDRLSPRGRSRSR